MAFFEVNGWSMEEIPIREIPPKRKRLSGPSRNASEKSEISTENVAGMSPNITRQARNDAPLHRQTKKKRKLNFQEQQYERQRTQNCGDRIALSGTTASVQIPLEKGLFKTDRSTPFINSSLTKLQKGLKDRLSGARFRLINEDLYNSLGHEAYQKMRNDPKVFEEYHLGFRHQVLSWPSNPVEHYVSALSLRRQGSIIADLGCGDAVLAKSLLPKGLSVVSFDLVSDNKFVIEADICSKIPLPGSDIVVGDKSTGEGQVVDVAVCALSLMSINWLGCIREAWRILKANGELHIAEVRSRFTDIDDFITLLSSVGFCLKYKDESNSHFILFEFKKIPRANKTEKEWENLDSKGYVLKPCVYRKR